VTRALPALLVAFALAGCSTASHPPLALAAKVDLPRFMGDWYVIASIPTFLEKDAYAAVESYRLAPDGRIETTFTYRAGGFDGAAKRYTPVATVADPATNAVWRMQFLWPFAADYRIVHVAPDYSSTVVAREKRDYAWIMARAPALPEAELEALAALLRAQGYDTTKLRKVPQRPS
jgi:apolipoprotein D and lipocalin family protein